MIQPTYSSLFLKAVFATLTFEGDYSDDLKDPGGETRWGISKRSHPNEDITNLSLDRALQIYNQEYWTPLMLGRFDWRVAMKTFDCAVQFGPEMGAKLLQQAIAACGEKLVTDGKLGPATLACADRIDPEALVGAICGMMFVKYGAAGKGSMLPGDAIRSMWRPG